MKIFSKYNIDVLLKALRLMGERGKAFVAAILVFNIIEAAGVPLFAYGIKGVVNAVTLQDIELFWRSVILIILNIVIWAAYAPISAYLCDWASKKAMYNIKTNIVEHLVSMPQSFHDSRPSGESLSLLSNDAGALQGIYDWHYFQVIRTAVVGLSGLITMFIIDWRFALIVMVLGTASVYTTSYFSQGLGKTGSRLAQQLAENSTDLYELLKAAKTNRLLGLSKHKSHSFSKQTNNEAAIRVKSSNISAKMNSTLEFINSFSYILILIIGGIFVYFKISDWGTIISLAGLKGTADCLFSECGIHMANMQRSLAGVKRILAALNEPRETVDISRYSFTEFIENPETDLALEDVGFAYEGNNEVLKSVNLKIKRGKITALAGESGSGKTTMMKIIMSLYQPTKGRVIFKDAAGVTTEALRNKTAYVPQDAMLFRGSIYDNIACGREGAAKDEVIAAAKDAGADEFISKLPKGYDTILLDDGKSLSGGQRQRIAIARALVKNAPILLLDEITSALDKENEKKIMETIYNLKKDKAVLLITHNDDVGAIADEVVML
jgi:ATP-binding cassette, subfamily B, bacterial